MNPLANLFSNVPEPLAEELVQTLFSAEGVRIERIVSRGQASKEGFWYDQSVGEWVVVLRGAARLLFEDGELMELVAGSYVNIEAHRRHRVEWTDPDQLTIWLAIYYGGRTMR